MVELVAIGAALAMLWLISLVQVVTTEDRYQSGTQLTWLLVVILTGPIGAVLFQICGRLPASGGWEAELRRERDRDRYLR